MRQPQIFSDDAEIAPGTGRKKTADRAPRRAPQKPVAVIQDEVFGRHNKVLRFEQLFVDSNGDAKALKSSPVMAAGVSDRLWFIEELINIAIDGRKFGVKEIRVLHRECHRTAHDVTNCVGCLERSGISAHSRNEQPGYGTVMVNEDSDKDRALQILRAQGFEVVDV